MTALAPGHVLGDRFQLIRRLGKGGMGEVWLVEDRELSDRVVAKLVPRDATEVELELLRRECRNARKLSHANIVPVYDFHQTTDACFITMAYVEGTDIGSLRGRPIADIVPRLIAVADALAYAHARGVIHRDLKAANILIDKDGEPRLLDFGIAGVLGGDEPSSDGAHVINIKGGGTEGAASPQQLAGGAPSPTDDIYAFGMLARDLLSGLDLPVALDALLNAATNREPAHRPQSMADIRHSLEDVRASLEPSPVKQLTLTPPPRARRVEAVVPPAVRASGLPPARPARPARLDEPLSAARRSGGVGGKTVVAFVLLLAAAIGVFVVLPRWVEESGSPLVETGTTREETSADARDTALPSELAREPEERDLEDLAKEMAAAENVLERVETLRESLDARGAGIWGGDAYRAALEAITLGEEQMGRRAFAEAAANFENALSNLESVQSSANRIAADAIRRGREALAAGSATEAEDAFSLALRIQPRNSEARSGIARAKVVDELRMLVARGEELEARGELDDAADHYRRAVALDPLSQDAQQGLARIDARASERAFTRAMSDAVAALNRRDFPSARAGYERARAIRPDAPGVRDGLDAVAQGERLEAIAEHRTKAADLETREQWRSAERHYQAVLDMDDTIRFAQEGKARARARAELSEKLEFHIANPARFSDPSALDDASETLDSATSVPARGARLEAQIARLQELVAEFSTPVQVRLLSDGETEVVVYKIGTIGKFDTHALVLRPGTYTVVGRRAGYRDVRYRLVVQADAPPEPLVVRCEEQI